VIDAIEPWKRGGKGYLMYYRGLLREIAQRHHFDIEAPFSKVGKENQKIILYGSDDQIWGRKYEAWSTILKGSSAKRIPSS
jgi:excinuclease UvrABC ATPase subunit